jgi:hypothetical protein
MAKVAQRGTDVVIFDDTDNEVLVIGSDGKLTVGDTPPAANPDTSGATLANLEIEVNQIKATLRAAGLIG